MSGNRNLSNFNCKDMESRRQGRSSSNLDNKGLRSISACPSRVINPQKTTHGAAVVHSHKLSAMQNEYPGTFPWLSKKEKQERKEDEDYYLKLSQLDLNTDYAQMVPIVEARRAVLAERASRPVKNDHVAPFFPNRRSKSTGHHAAVSIAETPKFCLRKETRNFASKDSKVPHREPIAKAIKNKTDVPGYRNIGFSECSKVDLDSAFYVEKSEEKSTLPDRRISNTKRLAVVSESMVDLENSDMFQDIENYIANIRSQKQLTKESNPDRRMESFEDFHTVKASLEKPDISGGTGAVVDKLITGGKKIAVKKSSEEKIHKGSQNRD